jgi:hypothetical protein
LVWAGDPRRRRWAPFGADSLVALAIASGHCGRCPAAGLVELGIDVAKASVVQTSATAKRADVIGGLANMRVDGQEVPRPAAGGAAVPPAPDGRERFSK